MACEKGKLEPTIRSQFYRQLSCDVTGAECLPLCYIAKWNLCLIFGMLKEMNGLLSECGSLKIPSFFGPAYLAVLEKVGMQLFPY